MSPVARKNILITIAIITGGMALIWGSMEYTSRPKFCNTCHYMEPFYQSWATSSHADIVCTECHFEPGLTGKIKGKLNGLYQVTKYVSLAYKKSKPWAEISDHSCMREGCHQEQTLLGPIEFKNVRFDHSHHLGELRRGKQLRCTSCHSQVVQGDHILVTEGTCFVCHMKDRDTESRLSQCQTCHTDDIFLAKGSQLRYNHTTVVQTAQSCESCHINTIEGNGGVSIQQCINCHWQTDFFEQYDNPEFLHLNHVTNNKVECTACHAPIVHQIRKAHMLTGEDCRSCHQDMHMAQARLFSGVIRDDFPPLPNPMFEAGLACQSCHIFHQENIGGGDTMVSRAKACDQCHGQGYGRLLQQWGKSIAYLKSDIISYLEEARHILEQEGTLSPQVSQDLERATGNIQLITSARGIHNIQLSNHLLEESHDLISQALEGAGKTSFLRTYIPSEQLVPSDCANCHFGIEEIAVPVYGLEFRHDRHLYNGVTCTKCHSNLRQHGELLFEREECLNCHHSQEDKDCSVCHDRQASLMSGETPFFTSEPDIMELAEIACQDCHLEAAGAVRKGAELCADCHDEAYPEMVMEWRDEITALMRDLPQDRYREQIEWLRNEGSLGGHNPQAVIDYLEELMQLTPRP